MTASFTNRLGLHVDYLRVPHPASNNRKNNCLQFAESICSVNVRISNKCRKINQNPFCFPCNLESNSHRSHTANNRVIKDLYLYITETDRPLDDAQIEHKQRRPSPSQTKAANNRYYLVLLQQWLKIVNNSIISDTLPLKGE